MTKRLIFSSVAMLTLMAAPAQASGTASAQAKVSIQITDLALEPGLLAYWSSPEKLSVGGGNGTGGGSANYGFMGGTGFWGTVTASAQTSSPPVSMWDQISRINGMVPGILEIRNPTGSGLSLGFVSTGQIDLDAVASGTSFASVSGRYGIGGYCYLCGSNPSVRILITEQWFWVGSLANEPNGPRTFSELRSEPFSLLLPAGATLYVDFGSQVQAVARSEGEITDVVPEPGTWAMMIAGFGLVGGMLRRRRLQLS